MTIVGLKIDRFNLSGAWAHWSPSDPGFWLVDWHILGPLIGQNDNTAQGDEVNNPGRRTHGTRSSPRWRLVSGNKSLKPIISQGHWRVSFLQIDAWVSLPRMDQWREKWRDLKHERSPRSLSCNHSSINRSRAVQCSRLLKAAYNKHLGLLLLLLIFANF